MTAFAAFERLVQRLQPRPAIVLGSGLGGVVEVFREEGSIGFADIPGLSPTTVRGHRGQLVAGHWDHVPALLFRGRLHFYEGHSHEAVTEPVRIARSLGIKAFILTNAAGGINPALKLGDLMAIHRHLKLINGSAWHSVVDTSPPAPYSTRLIELMRSQEALAGRELMAGTYAALTGPSYETPAEIRALAACGADAVGMSTALEAETAAECGLEVAAISCVTNAAAGLSAGLLSHAEVLDNAKLGVQRLCTLLGHVVKAM